MHVSSVLVGENYQGTISKLLCDRNRLQPLLKYLDRRSCGVITLKVTISGLLCDG